MEEEFGGIRNLSTIHSLSSLPTGPALPDTPKSRTSTHPSLDGGLALTLTSVQETTGM